MALVALKAKLSEIGISILLSKNNLACIMITLAFYIKLMPKNVTRHKELFLCNKACDCQQVSLLSTARLHSYGFTTACTD